jgi:subtilisin-like proprotein convertase family protein
VFLSEGQVHVMPLGTNAVLPGGAAQIAIAINNEGGAAATAVTAALTSSSPDVIILQSASSYATLAPGGAATNATLFAFFVSPNAACGEVLPFTLTINYTGNGAKPVALGFTAQTGRPSPAAQHFAYTGPVVAIPDADPAGVDIPLPVAFNGGIASLGFNLDGTACDANESTTTVGVDHTWVGDLTFKLISPSGRVATLIDAAGGMGNSGNNFCQTQLSDAAGSSIEAVTIDEAPFTGEFSPLVPLSTFAGDTANGTWILHVTDNAFVDTGSVHAFSLDVNGYTCGP